MRRLVLSILAIVSLFFAAGAAEAAPAVSSDDSVVSSDATAQETRLRRQTERAIAEHFNILHDPVKQTRVERIVERLRPYMERSLDYRVSIIDHEMVNAFAIAGGGMYVATGMLDFVRSDLELAGVIAHEMIHADRNHVIKQMARNQRMTLLALAAMIASKGNAPIMMAANALQIAIMGQYSIDIERESDARGIDALGRAGYDPVGMLTLQERMQEESLKRPPINFGIYQTHPETKERIAAAEKYIEQSGRVVNRKLALGVLRTRVERSEDLTLLTMDGDVLLASSDDAAMDSYTEIAHRIDGDLRLETPPFDVRVEGSGTSRALYIGPRRIATARDAGVGDPDILRSRIHDALTVARRTHPLADYFK